MATNVQTANRAPSSVDPFPRGTSQITQANMVNRPTRPPEVVQRLSFSSETIKRLTSDDFDLSSKEMITLKYDDCVLILFHVENTESYQLADIWAIVAQQTAGPVFAAINMLSERKVAEAFTRLKADGSNPMHWAALRQYPSIMVYRKRWPVAVYNGPREVQAIIDYALTLACEAGYYETIQIGGSMQGEARIEMGPYDPYTNIPGSPPRIRKDSVEYSAEQPVRGFNPNIPVVVTGSASARAATGEIRSEEIREQQGEAEGVATSLTEEAEAAPTIDPITGEPVVAAPSVSAPLPSETPQEAVATPAAPQESVGTPVAPQESVVTPAAAPQPSEPEIAVPATSS